MQRNFFYIFISFLLLFSDLTLSKSLQNNQSVISFVIKLTTSLFIKAKGLRAYYKGNPFIFNDENICIVSEKKRHTFTLIIVKDTHLIMESNRKKYFKLKPNAPFLWYDLDLFFDDPLDSFIKNPHYHWHINPRKPEDVSLRIPEDALIILLDPHFIEELYIPPYSHVTNKCNALTIYLPYIKIKEHITTQEFEKALIQHLLDFEIKTFHKTPEIIVEKINEQHIITLPCINQREL
jgi:hypothetical protein